MILAWAKPDRDRVQASRYEKDSSEPDRANRAALADEAALWRDHFPHACDLGDKAEWECGDGQTKRPRPSFATRVAFSELSRRRHELWSVTGPEFEDLAQQAAGDAVVSVLDRLEEFRGLSRFTTWAYKFVVFEVGAKVARHAWRRQPPGVDELPWDELPDRPARRPEDRLEQRAQLDALSRAIRELTDRQREVFVAIALNDVPIDVLAVKLGTNRNVIYKNLFDARRALRARMAAAGHPISDATRDRG